MIMRKILFDAIFLISSAMILSMSSCSNKTDDGETAGLSPVPFENVAISGELRTRILKNMDRLEEPKYQPQHVFLTEEESGNWPGDTEGRAILGLILDARASGREPLYLERIINAIPEHLNEKGYMGPIYNGKMSEQQLSGNGWMLRGLCEYYDWKKDEKILSIIKSIVNDLFVKGKGFYTVYPIDPGIRDTSVGAESGSILNENEKWMLSSDVGCVFIGMEGLIHAYKYVRTEEVKSVIEEMIERFLQIDLIGIKAQTHASLTACRGLVRFAEITGEKKYIDEAEKRWIIYKSDGMTENHENYNWFDRFDTWTEPCAIIDSYMLAVQLWQHTGNPVYREDAESIYYNAICHTQRYNGGFGCDNCPGNEIHDVCLKVHVDEAHWCCTMRGGEGLARVAEYSYFVNKDTIYVPFFRPGKLSLSLKKNTTFTLLQQTDYPFDGKVRLEVKENTAGIVSLKLAIPSSAINQQLKINGKDFESVIDRGFIQITKDFKQGDSVELTFDRQVRFTPTLNKYNTNLDQFLVYYGPLMLGVENGNVFKLDKSDEIVQVGDLNFRVKDKDIFLTPVYHLMDPKVWSGTNYKKQILF